MQKKYDAPFRTSADTAMVSGIGILSPIGNSPDEVIQSLFDRRDGIAKAQKIDTSKFASELCAEVRNFSPSENMEPNEIELFDDPYIRLAICAARRALSDANFWEITPERGEKIAMVLGTCNAGMNSAQLEYECCNHVSIKKFDKKNLLESEYCGLIKAFASTLKICGDAYLISTACSSSTTAIGLASKLVESGKYDAVITGGSDAVCLANYAGFNSLRVISPAKTAPFSTPIGMNIGEGAAFWVLESAEKLQNRGGSAYGKVIGFSTSGDAYHPTRPDPRGEGAYKAMYGAILDAGVRLDEIGCINAHGSGTEANDKAENKAIAKLLCGKKIPFTSTKSYHAHCMGATGAIEATCQLLSMNSDFIPPTLHNSGTRAGCDISPSSDSDSNAKYDCFLSANYAFAGSNSAIVVCKPNFEKYAKSEKICRSCVITGMGNYSTLALGNDETLEKIESGEIAFKGSNYAKTTLPNLRSYDRRIDFSGMGKIAIQGTISTKLAFAQASLKMERKILEKAGIIVGICRGSPRDAHMKGVLDDENMRGDIACFSNVTANSSAGWISKAFEIKGCDTTLTSGFNCGIQALYTAASVLKNGTADLMLAIASDEISPLQMSSYKKVGLLLDSYDEFESGCSSENATVPAEGSATFILEPREKAEARNAEIFGEVLSGRSACDIIEYGDYPHTCEALKRATEAALADSNIGASEIGLIVMSPRGCESDHPSIEYAKSFGVPIFTSVFNTGYAESSSILQSLAIALAALSKGKKKLRCGSKELNIYDKNIKYVLCLASGAHTGNNFACVIKRD